MASEPNLNDWKMPIGQNDMLKNVQLSYPYYVRLMSHFEQIGGFEMIDKLMLGYDNNGETHWFPLRGLDKFLQLKQFTMHLFTPEYQRSDA